MNTRAAEAEGLGPVYQGEMITGADPATGGFRALIGLVKTRPWSLGGACLTSAMAAASGLMPYVAVYWIAEEALRAQPNMDVIWRSALLGMMFTLLKFILAIVSHSLAHAGAFGILYDVRIRLAKKMARVPLGFFNRRDAGSLQKAMTDDVSGLEAFLAHMLPDGAAAFTVHR